MGKLEKFGRSILKKLGSGRNQNRRRGAVTSSSSSSTSSDEEQMTLTPNYVHSFQVIPPDDVVTPPESSEPEDVVRIASPAGSDEGSAGYATDDTALSSLSPLDVKRTSVDYSESQGYYSTAELSPVPRLLDELHPPNPPNPPRIVITPTVPLVPTVIQPRYVKKQEYPRVNVSNRLLKKDEPMFKSSQGLAENLEPPKSLKMGERSATLSNLTQEIEDPIEKFLKNSIYKTKMITTVFEAKDKGIEEIYEDVTHEIDRWFETKNMMAVACELHWSVPREKRSRQLESKLKEKLLNALRENNKRLLYLRGMGKSTSPVKLAESKTVENISRDRETDSLLITATNSEDESLTSSEILKIHVENLEDNEPRFLQSANPVFLINKNTSKPTAIGRLTAYNPDEKPIFYRILPKCGSEMMSKNFSIDPEFGEIVYHPKSVVNQEIRVELCVIATSEKEKDVEDVFFDGAARNMRKVLVQFTDEQKSPKINQKTLNSMRISGNQTVSQVGDVLDRIEIPMMLNEAPIVEYKLKDLQFVPANYELGRDVISPEGSVELNKNTGELVANGKILDTPQGIYTAKITRGEGNMAVKQLHHIKNDRKLRYVLAMSRNEFGANSQKLRRQILEAVGTEEKSADKKWDVFFDAPTMDKKNATWTSVCFYLTRDNAILDDKQMTSLISSSNGHIAKLHHIFKVVNVDACAPRSSQNDASISSTSSVIPTNTLILIGVVGVLIIALIALLVFVCCVSRYQRYLKMKTERMRCTSSTGSYYKSPNLIPPPPPGYVHTPPPPPPPAAIAFY